MISPELRAHVRMYVRASIYVLSRTRKKLIIIILDLMLKI